MKSLLRIFTVLLALTLAVPKESDGQVLTRQVPASPYKDSVTAAGTKYFSFFSTSSGVVGVTFESLKATTGGGTINSYVILQTRNDTIPTTSTSLWEDYRNPITGTRDTLFLTDGTDLVGHTWPVPVQYFNGIRAKVVSTGAQKFYVWYSNTRR